MTVQARTDRAGTPLWEATFCVLDLETTGGAPRDCAITEIGAVKVRGGETEGTFHTLVSPGAPVPAFIRLLTGITDEMLVGAPGIDSVLPSLLEFLRNSVLVAHNARFDLSFLQAALQRAGYEALSNRVLDTAQLARKVLAGDVPNRKLDTLARHLRCAHKPCHRAFADALATVDVLHGLIERVSGFGVTTIEDLEAMSAARMDDTFTKISLADHLPRDIGVYRFLGEATRTLYIGKATDMRTRVRSYFHGDPRRGVRDLLRETRAIVAEPYPTVLEAEVAEARGIARETPPYNRAGKATPRWYVRIAPEASTPRAHATRRPKNDGAVYVGPMPSKMARAVLDALREALPIHRCARPERCRGCAFSDLGACSGTDRAAHRRHMRSAARALAGDAGTVLDALERRMRRLAALACFERAAQVRERGALLERVVARAAQVRALIAAGDVVLGVGGRALLLRDAQLAAAEDAGERGAPPLERLNAAARSTAVEGFLPPEIASEARVIASWIARRAPEARLLHVTGPLSTPTAARARGRFRPRGGAPC